jgi:Transposase IS116/IS110/IS902 family
MNTLYTRSLLRTMVRSAYDLQKLRIEMGNRLVAQFKSKLGGQPGKKEIETIDDEGQDLLKDLKVSFAKLTEGVAKELPSKRNWKGDELITSHAEGILLYNYITLERNEAKQFRLLVATLDEFPIYTEFLQRIRGCGPTMSAVVISEIDIAKARYPSSLWAYAGLDVVATDWKGRSRHKEHLRQISYINKDGKPATRLGITFNPLLKTKLTGVLGPCLIKAGSDPYKTIYDGYKHRLESHPKWSASTKAHRHNAAIRYMIKRFLCDLYAAWRPLENLETSPEYAEAKLRITHRAA